MNFLWLVPSCTFYFNGPKLPAPAAAPTIVNPASTAALNEAEQNAAGAQGAESNNVAGLSDAYAKRQLSAAEMSKRGKAASDLLV